MATWQELVDDHGFRGSYCAVNESCIGTWSRGAAMKVVHELLGHAAIEMTMRYAHLSLDVPRYAVKLLDGLGSGSGIAGRQLGDSHRLAT